MTVEMCLALVQMIEKSRGPGAWGEGYRAAVAELSAILDIPITEDADGNFKVTR